ncbi:MAG: hypothetical protein PHD76_00985 [Methylacidiphilales bacterium]|nr:hypothetical protein [Candidatus Methylacidiphilales bacterium]
MQMFIYQAGIFAKPGDFLDADGYTRLMRVQHLRDTGNWYDTTVPRSNPDKSETSQWSRLLDLILLLCAGAGSCFTDFKTALLWSGILISPLFYVLGLLAIVWACRPVVKPGWLGMLCPLLATQPGILLYCAAGRPDHHALLFFLLALNMGCMLRCLCLPFSPKAAWVAGLVQAVSLSISIETLVITAINFLVLGMLWLRGEKLALHKNLFFSTSLLACSTLLYSIQTRPDEWNAGELDRMSLVHLLVFSVVAAFWAVLAFMNSKGRCPQSLTACIVAGLAGAGVAAVAAELANPRFLLGPLANVSPEAMKIWANLVQEQRPLFSSWHDFPGAVILWLFPCLFAIPWAVWRLFVRGAAFKTEDLYLLLATLVFCGLALYQYRWVLYAEAVALPLFVQLTGSCLEWVSERYQGVRLSILRVSMMGAFFTANLFLGFGLKLALAEKTAPAATNASSPGKVESIHTLCDWLNRESGLPPKQRILAFQDFGTEIIYRTPYEVVATPNHRNEDGILFAYHAMTASNADTTRQLLASKHITLLLLAPHSGEPMVYSKPGNQTVFYSQLLNGQCPDWLIPVPLPPHLASGYRLYRVNLPAAR